MGICEVNPINRKNHVHIQISELNSKSEGKEDIRLKYNLSSYEMT